MLFANTLRLKEQDTCIYIYVILVITLFLPNRIYGWSIGNSRRMGPQARIDLIFPGTKWCGSGNIAANFTDLGTSEAADNCCREHDNCPDVMTSGQTKYNLTNNSFYTRLICKCDDDFYSCLKKNNDYTSFEIGIVYFNVLGTECYKYDYPIVKCRKTNTLLKRCEDYELNKTLEKKWQWFDVAVY